MTAFADLSELVNRMTGGNSGTPVNVPFYKDARVGAAVAAATVAGRITSLWEYNGSPSHGAVPGAVSVPTNATAGSLRQANPGGGRQLWCTGVWAMALSPGTLVLYDRLLHISGLSGTVTTPQTVGGSLTRYATTTSAGNEIWCEIYTIIGTTGTTITASYTNQAGTAGQTTQATAFGGTAFREAQRIIKLPLASGDNGVRAVASVDLVASTGTAGNFGVSIVRPLAVIPIPATGVGYVRDFVAQQPGIQEILTDACLAWAWHANTTTAPQVHGGVQLVER